jgi:hypothetical protein
MSMKNSSETNRIERATFRRSASTHCATAYPTLFLKGLFKYYVFIVTVLI